MTIWLWVGFILFVAVMLSLDLGVINRSAREVNTRRALMFSGVCVLLALAFTVAVYFIYENHWFGMGGDQGTLLPRSGIEAAGMFLAGWLVEQSLSLDNIFVFAVIFGYFAVPRALQNRALLWGVIGALVLRGVMIAAGVALIQNFHWIIYAFGVMLIATAIKLLRAGDDPVRPDRNFMVILARRFCRVSPDFDGELWLTRMDGKAAITPLFLVMPVIATTDVLFAVDSIPAVFAITHDSFLVFTSNVFAVLNLRSLYFVLAKLLDRFRLLKYSLVFILAYVGIKMLLTDLYHIPTGVTLAVIAVALAGGMVASAMIRPKDPA
jgi:tellurite resistance protein TerC